LVRLQVRACPRSLFRSLVRLSSWFAPGSCLSWFAPWFALRFVPVLVRLSYLPGSLQVRACPGSHAIRKHPMQPVVHCAAGRGDLPYGAVSRVAPTRNAETPHETHGAPHGRSGRPALRRRSAGRPDPRCGNTPCIRRRTARHSTRGEASTRRSKSWMSHVCARRRGAWMRSAPGSPDRQSRW